MKGEFFCVVGALTIAAAGCSNGDSSKSGGPPRSGEGTLWVLASQWAQAIDLQTGEPVSDIVQVDDSSTSIYTMVASHDQLWIGRRDGVVVGVDGSSGESHEIVVDAAETSGISEVAIGESLVYVGSTARASLPDPAAPPLVTIDRATFRERERKDVFGPSINERFRSIIPDGDTVWILHETDFEILKLDVETLEVVARLPLAERPDDPMGSPVQGYGYGMMSLVGDALWVVDQSSDRLPLWRVDTATLSAERVRSLAEAFDIDAQGCLRMTGNRDSLFVLFCDDSADEIVRFDGHTGAIRDVYQFESPGPNTLVASDSMLYADSEKFPFDVLGVDLASGEQSVVYTDPNYVRAIAIPR